MSTQPEIHHAGSAYDPVEAAREACSRIAPSWPLDRFIAVNPWWKHIDRPFPDFAVRLATLCGSRPYMDRDWFRQKWEDGTIGYSDLRAACRLEEQPFDEKALFAHLEKPAPGGHLLLVTHGMDSWRDLRHNVSWEEEVVYQISQFCAAYFDQGQSIWHMDNSQPLYPAWKASVVHELGIGLLTGANGLEKHFAGLPDNPGTLLNEALEALEIPTNRRIDYLEALLLSINGWASWCAWRGWQDSLDQAPSPDTSIEDLLAIRLAWEWVLFRHAREKGIPLNWPSIVQSWEMVSGQHRCAMRLDRAWHRALEISCQNRLLQNFSRSAPEQQPVQPEVAAYFCIDVRSEPFRRALEGQDQRIRTGGFAGFFGIPIAYRGSGLDVAIPQLPGLLGHTHVVGDECRGSPADGHHLARQRRQRLHKASLKDWLGTAATSIFPYVESAGLLFGLNILRDAFQAGKGCSSGLTPAEADRLKPSFNLATPARVEEAADLAGNILRGMSLIQDFPKLVLLAGHGSSSANNPHAAGLDCGACCGQSGEVNARVVARLLNDSRIRSRLCEQGIRIPKGTRFLAGLHNTTTDELRLFDLDECPEHLQASVQQLEEWLTGAGHEARAERAGRLGLGRESTRGLLDGYRRRSRDWSEIRPEWGLANNHSFIVAPRSRTRHLNLQGRSFLHDYDWRIDEDFRILEQIMTAPMIVTHWINMQYYASTVDNKRYGSGNKVLHNVVGGNIGVFEGNGGDLRIGLARQSLHDGENWMHEPVRLNVFIAAPREAIDQVIASHETVRQLVHNEWLHLFQLGSEGETIHQRIRRGWKPATGRQPQGA